MYDCVVYSNIITVFIRSALEHNVNSALYKYVLLLSDYYHISIYQEASKHPCMLLPQAVRNLGLFQSSEIVSDNGPRFQ